MIPNVLHFVFGMAPDFGGKPFSLVHYLSLRSAIELNKPDAAIFHYQYEPMGEWWDRIKPRLRLNKIKAPETFMGRPVIHVAHRADVVRLQALKETGGIYMDLDTISVKPLTDLLDDKFVIGQEKTAGYTPRNFRQRVKYSIRRKLGMQKQGTQGTTGLCNAVLLASKDSFFLDNWLDSYKTFRSEGRDKYWNEHSVKVPERLARYYPQQITQLGPYAFHYPLYDAAGLKALFEELHEYPDAYLHHLWESFSWEPYLSKLTPELIRTKDTTYNIAARPYLD